MCTKIDLDLCTKIELYFMSLGLLFFLLIIKSIDIPISFSTDSYFVGWGYLLKHNVTTIVCLACLIGSIICRKRFLHSLEGCQDLPCKIEYIKNGNYEYLTFLTTYIIPLICFDLGSVRDCILLLILLALLGVLFIKTNLYYLNPSLALIGFNIYIADIKYKDTTIPETIILSKTKLKKGDKFYKHDLEHTDVVYCQNKIE